MVGDVNLFFNDLDDGMSTAEIEVRAFSLLPPVLRFLRTEALSSTVTHEQLGAKQRGSQHIRCRPCSGTGDDC